MNLPTPELTTERFVLRPIREEDVSAFWPTFSNEDAMRWWSRAHFSSRDELHDYLLADDWGGRTWIAEPKGGGTPLCRVIATLHDEGVSEIGYLTVLGSQGQGIARECVSALITHLFKSEGNRRIWADVDPDNAASNGLLKKLGFTNEGTMREAWKTHIGVRDSYIWSLLSREWR